MCMVVSQSRYTCNRIVRFSRSVFVWLVRPVWTKISIEKFIVERKTTHTTYHKIKHRILIFTTSIDSWFEKVHLSVLTSGTTSCVSATKAIQTGYKQKQQQQQYYYYRHRNKHANINTHKYSLNHIAFDFFSSAPFEWKVTISIYIIYVNGNQPMMFCKKFRRKCSVVSFFMSSMWHASTFYRSIWAWDQMLVSYSGIIVGMATYRNYVLR